ncbi:GNAT family N-acetyltransferase [Cellulomonas fimi]|uniref:GNAT family N-acetyltransferase n=1 Tax=Cellulomonas fimi TaxID=1708 RepID=UPI00146145B9|nr:GNAT family N-acetyltransferase [Cellulomonas fimi]
MSVRTASHGPRLLRPGVPADAQAIAEFQTASWREAYQGLVPQRYLDRVTVQDRAERWHHRLATGSRRVAVAEDDGVVVGVASWGRVITPDVPPLELMSIYVAAELRGTGLAAELLHAAVGTSPAHLWVFAENWRAQAFYAKHGFRHDGYRKLDRDTGLWERRFVRRGAR